MIQQTATSTANIFPFLRYRDAPAAIEWLAGAFGFEKQMVVPGPDATIAHAQMRIGSGVIMLGSARGNRPASSRPREIEAVEQGIYIFVEDVDAHYRRAKAAGAEIVRELENTDYGSREYSACDLEGFYWSFGTYQPNGSE